MKINQLFTKQIEIDLVLQLLACFGLESLSDKKMFSKNDMVQLGTVQKLMELIPTLQQYYLPCKAKLYLNNINEKRALTILKQILRLHHYFLLSIEKNIQNKKIIFYKLLNQAEYSSLQHMKQVPEPSLLTFS